jgi:hypothetical protein
MAITTKWPRTRQVIQSTVQTPQFSIEAESANSLIDGVSVNTGRIG